VCPAAATKATKRSRATSVLLRIRPAGSVDDGEATLIGRRLPLRLPSSQSDQLEHVVDLETSSRGDGH